MEPSGCIHGKPTVTPILTPKGFLDTSDAARRVVAGTVSALIAEPAASGC
jgi:hypothetical protein